jgi:plastocyanin domain-containing protein
LFKTHPLCCCLLLACLASAAPLATPHESQAQAAEPAVREIEVIVDKGAYKPSRIEVRVGERVRLKFLRKEFNGCTREVVFPKLDIRRELPSNKPVYVDLPTLTPGDYEFKCGMNMVKGVLVVKPA